MVVIWASATEPTGTLQLLTARPFTCTVQAPQAAIPQPNLVPVNPSSSRMTQSSGASDSTSTSWITPLTFNRIPMIRPPDCGVDGGAGNGLYGFDAPKVSPGCGVDHATRIQGMDQPYRRGSIWPIGRTPVQPVRSFWLIGLSA